MSNNHSEPPKHYIKFEAPSKSMHKAAQLNCSQLRAIWDAIWDQWTICYLAVALCFTGIAIYRTIIGAESAGFDWVCASVLVIPAFPFILIRFLRSYRILRRGVAVVGVITADRSPMTTPLIGKQRPTRHNRMRMVYTYHYQGEQYSGVTGDSSLRAGGLPIRETDNTIGEVEIILIDPEDPNIARATPYDITLSKPLRKHVAEQLGLIVLL